MPIPSAWPRHKVKLLSWGATPVFTSSHDNLLPSEVAAARLGCSQKTLSKWRVIGRGPKFIKLGTSKQARIRYREADLISWLAENSYSNTSEVGAPIKQRRRMDMSIRRHTDDRR